MLTALLIPLVALPVMDAAVAPPADDPAVQVWLSTDDVVWPGERIRVYAEAQGDGYLLVLHAEPDGRIRVLFPLDPIDDHYVRGGKRYELLSRANGEAITVFADGGVGTVLAAYSRDPFQFGELLRGDHWDYQLPDVWWVAGDAESDLLGLADRMANGSTFSYDAKRYGVSQAVAYQSPVYGYPYASAYVTSGVYLSVGFTFGAPYFAYSPACWDWYYCYPGWHPYYGWYPWGPYYYRPVYYAYPHYWYPSYGYRYPGYYYPVRPYYPKYTSKTPAYRPDGGIDYRRRTGAVQPADARGGVSTTTRRRAPGATSTGADVARPTSPGRRTTGASGAPTARDATPSRAGAGSAPQRGDARRGVDKKEPTKGATPARPTRRSTGNAATERRTEVTRPAGTLPQRVYPTRGTTTSDRTSRTLRETATSGRTTTARPTTSTTRADTRPQRVYPSRSRSVRMPARSSAGSPTTSSTRATNSRAIRSVGGSSALPTRTTGSRAVRGVTGRSVPARTPTATSRGISRPPSMARPSGGVAPRISRPSGSVARPRAPAVRRAPAARGRR